MKKEAKFLLKKGTDSLLLSVEQFNKPFDTGRTEAVLILLDHSIEMLLKASIVQRGGKIKARSEGRSIVFEKCLRVAVSDLKIKFLTEEQVVVLQSLHEYRNAAQHYLLEISEALLYITAQSSVSLFGKILETVFDKDLSEIMPLRTLPVSANMPTDIDILFENETQIIKQLLQPNQRKRTEARAKLRPLVIMDIAIQGQSRQPSDSELDKIGTSLVEGDAWEELFLGVSGINITTTGYGIALEIRWTKKEGVPLRIVSEDDSEAGVISIKRVSELDFYSMSFTRLRENAGLTQPKCSAVLWYLNIEADPDCLKEIKINAGTYKQYSRKALEIIQRELPKHNLEDIWQQYKEHKKISNSP